MIRSIILNYYIFKIIETSTLLYLLTNFVQTFRTEGPKVHKFQDLETWVWFNSYFCHAIIKRRSTDFLYSMLKLCQNKKNQKFVELHHFWILFFWQQSADQDSKNGAAQQTFGPSYFVRALVRDAKYRQVMLRSVLRQKLALLG